MATAAAAHAGLPPLIITVAPNGARRGKSDHPALPITPREIAADAAACLEAGAAMIHLHVRGPDGDHTLDTKAYQAAIEEIRRAVGERMVIQVTSESVGKYGPDEQMAMVRDLRPEAVSLAIRELMPDDSDETDVGDFLAWLAADGIMPQYILYSAEDVARFAELRARGIVPGERAFLLFVLGRYARDQRSTAADLLPFLAAYRDTAPWAVCAFGPEEAACVMAAAALGGHVRVGFENNLFMADGRQAADNAALVGQAAAAASAIGRPVADAADLRELFRGPPPMNESMHLGHEKAGLH